jgi:hypothetical protein
MAIVECHKDFAVERRVPLYSIIQIKFPVSTDFAVTFARVQYAIMAFDWSTKLKCFHFSAQPRESYRNSRSR